MRYLLLIILTINILPVHGQSESEKRAIQDMTEWIESPMELNESPTTISIRDSRKIVWPSEEIVAAYLVDFTDSKGEKYVGFTGPITWTFFSINYDKLSNEELYNLYTGWFICFYSSQEENKNDEKSQADQKLMAEKIKQLGYQDFKIEIKIQMAEQTFFEISAKKDGKDKFIVGTINDMVEYDSYVILPLYKYIGELWDPLNME
jgi:hypothetical protein